jgi:hypothetical protein
MIKTTNFFISGIPDSGIFTLLEVIHRLLILSLCQSENVFANAPYASTIRLFLFDGYHVYGHPFTDSGLQDGTVKGELVDVTIPSSVRLHPLERVTSLQIDDPLFRIKPVHPDLAWPSMIGVPDYPFG